MSNNGQQITVAPQARLAMPSSLTDLDAGKWRVLCESVFPSAKSAESIVMALDYCRARRLDPFKRPVNIVPMWNKSLGREVETVWPGINEVQTTAARTGKYAGMDEPKFGPDKTRTFKGVVKWKEGNAWKEDSVELMVTYPEWASVTVYKMVEGQRCPFTEPVYWEEAYARRGKTEVPNDMWAKRPRGQVLKVAKAFSLRAAFPEEGEYVAEEMEGKEIEAGGVVIEHEPAKNTMKPYDVDYTKPASPWKTAALRNKFQTDLQISLQNVVSTKEADALIVMNKEKLDAMRASGDERDLMSVTSIHNTYKLARERLSKPLPDEIQGRDVPPEEGGLTPEELSAEQEMDGRAEAKMDAPDWLKRDMQF